MSNIKLSGHNWATDGIYDTAQGKTQKAINAELYDGAGTGMYFTNVTAGTWVNQGSSATYSDFPYRCSLTSGNFASVKSTMFAMVVYNPTQVLSGNYAPVCQTYNGGVYLYSKVNTSITVPTIAVFK